MMEVIASQRYYVRIGGDLFLVESETNQGARQIAAGMFKERYNLSLAASYIAYHAKTKLVSTPPSPEMDTQDLLERLTDV